MGERRRALALDLLCINQPEEVISPNLGATSDRSKEIPAQKQAAGDSTSWAHQSRHAHSHDEESGRNATVRPRMAAVSYVRWSSVNPKMEQRELPKTNLTPALPIEVIRAGLLQLGIDTRDIRAVLTHTEFSDIPFRSHQLCFIQRYASDVLHRTLSTQQLAVLFQMNPSTVRRTLLRGPQRPGPLGRHMAIADDHEADLVAHILEAFRAGKTMTRKELLQMVRERYDHALTDGWVNAFIGRHLDALKCCRSLPQEDTRLTVPRVQLEEHIQTMKIHVAGRFSELIFNLDELGSADWEDRKVKKVIVPADVRKEDVYHAVSRRHRHVTLLACVSAAGDALTPMLITGNTIRESLWGHGLRPDEDVMIRRRNPAYLDGELFYEYISTVLIPYVSSLRGRPQLVHQAAVLLMDSALPHTSERILRILGENNIIALTFPAHTTNLFQALDLVFFGSLKHLKATAVGELGDDSASDHLTKLVQAYEQTATSSTIRGSFRRAGMIPDTTTRPYKIMVDEAIMRESPGFQAVWERNVSVGDLSRRRQMQRFGIINSEFLPA